MFLAALRAAAPVSLAPVFQLGRFSFNFFAAADESKIRNGCCLIHGQGSAPARPIPARKEYCNRFCVYADLILVKHIALVFAGEIHAAVAASEVNAIAELAEKDTGASAGRALGDGFIARHVFRT